MNIQEQVSLREHSTMRLGGNAAYLCEVTSRQDVSEAVAWAEERSLPILAIGDGSNIVWRDEGFEGLIIVNKIMGYEDRAEDANNHYITVGAGENWDSVVERSVSEGLSGIECLSLIPGTAGATPVQNVGAYGQEISNSLVSVEVYDKETHTFTNIPNIDCRFGYRTSRFKTTDRDRYIITGILLHLTTTLPQPPLYPAIDKYLKEHSVEIYDASVLRDAVTAIRRSKLPDPASVANNGSFFGNPIIDRGTFTQIQADYPMVPHWEVEGGIKLSAAWIIEQVGFKDFHDTETGMATWAHQPLVFVNESAEKTEQLLTFRQKIVDKVKAQFDVDLQQEPELLP